MESAPKIEPQFRPLQFSALLKCYDYFHVVTTTTEGVERTFALGGYDFSAYLDSVEELDPETLIWRESPLNLVERRYQFGAVELPKSLVC